ncbi:hypothetical protein TNCV_2670301 [Trichonephila clavipes]|nr:hypothetical protein TNCV_2670301 [Trichonephila clavipes]
METKSSGSFSYYFASEWLFWKGEPRTYSAHVHVVILLRSNFLEVQPLESTSCNIREHSQYRFKLISGPGHRISTGRYSVPRHWRIEIYNQKIGLSPAYPGPYECFRAQAPNE